MLNTGLLKIIVMVCKLVAYSSNPQSAEIDMLVNGQNKGKIMYVKQNKVMKIYHNSKRGKIFMMTVTRIDNGLYKVKYRKERAFKVDLAPVYMKLNWKKLYKTRKTIKLPHNENVMFIPKKKYLYVNYDKTSFSINKRLLIKR
mgnify:CR=1 FL=1